MYAGLRRRAADGVSRLGAGGGRPATTVRKGLTLAGNRRARRALVEAAWTYRYPARVSETLRVRLERLPKAVRDIAWKAQVRLCAWAIAGLSVTKKLPVVVAAIAREMAAFLWATAARWRPRKAEPPHPLHSAGGGATGGELPSLVMWPGSPDARPLDRGKPRDEDTEGGNQPADKSLINRRLQLHPQPCAASIGQAARHPPSRPQNHVFILDRGHKRLPHASPHISPRRMPVPSASTATV